MTAAARPLPVLPPVIVGTSALGNLYRIMPEAQRAALIGAALGAAGPAGSAVFDCAGKYGAGLALEALGRNLTTLGADPSRVLISNKLGWRRVPLTTPEPTFEPGAWAGLKHDAVQDISADGILRCAEQGNALLGPTWTPQLVSVHDPDEFLAAGGAWNDVLGAYRSLDHLRASGAVRAVGVGAKSAGVIDDLAKAVRLDWAMFACCLTIHRHDAAVLALVERLRRAGTAVIASAVFNGGFLTGSAWYDYRQPEAQREAPLFAWRERFHALCRRFAVAPDAACVGFVRAIPGVVAVALNATRPERIAANHALAAAGDAIPAAFWTAAKDDTLIDPTFPYLG